MRNTLYYGDNLDILRRYIDDGTVNLIYLDPPFNSNADYNVLFAEKDGTRAPAQIKAFEDTWTWDLEAAAEYGEVLRSGHDRVAKALKGMHDFLGGSDMIDLRLIELRRVLKPTGSIYLHCDPDGVQLPQDGDGLDQRVDSAARVAILARLVLPDSPLQAQSADNELAMPLPKTDRVIYSRNPLAEVTAQLKFPPILKIESETPAQFQDHIRDRYPRYQQVRAGAQLPPDLPPPVRNLIQSMGAAAGPNQHVFETDDRRSVVTLSRESLTFKTTTYTRWETFREHLELLRGKLEQLYRPAFYSRIGLRYVDIIRRSVLGLDNVPWSELLNPAVGGELTAPELGESVDSASSQLHCKLEGENRFLTLRRGIALAEPNKERCFLIDCDFHTHKRTELANVNTVLDTFNRDSGNLFRWAIRDRLRDALQPRQLD